MDLSTRYLGFRLRTPLVVSSSPLSDDPDGLHKLVDAGISAVVLRSWFTDRAAERERGARTSLDNYLRHLSRLREALGVPVLASLSGTAPDDWVEPAQRVEEAGADALELNVYYLPADLGLSGVEIERAHVGIVSAVRQAVGIPIAVKMSPWFTNVGHVARQLVDAGADGLVLFNRFYQPDLELETGRAVSRLLLSTEQDLRLPLRWIGLLHGRIDADFAATGGIRTGQDAMKLLAVGAVATMLCSALLEEGMGAVPRILEELEVWMDAGGFSSVRDLRGSMAPAAGPQALVFERAQYVQTLRPRER